MYLVETLTIVMASCGQTGLETKARRPDGELMCFVAMTYHVNTTLPYRI